MNSAIMVIALLVPAENDEVLRQIHFDWNNRQQSMTSYEFVLTGHTRIEKHTIVEPEFFAGAHPHEATYLPFHRVYALDFARGFSRYEDRSYVFLVAEQRFKADFSLRRQVADTRLRPLFFGFGLLDVQAKPARTDPDIGGWQVGPRDASPVVTLSRTDAWGWVTTIDVDLSKQSAVTRYDHSRGLERWDAAYINYKETPRGWFASNWIWQDYSGQTLHRTEYAHVIRMNIR